MSLLLFKKEGRNSDKSKETWSASRWMLCHAVHFGAVCWALSNFTHAPPGNGTITPPQAERMAAQMVVEERMRASIDQIDGVIRFEAGVYCVSPSLGLSPSIGCHTLS